MMHFLRRQVSIETNDNANKYYGDDSGVLTAQLC